MAKKVDSQGFIVSPSYMEEDDFLFLETLKGTKEALRNLNSPLVISLSVEKGNLVNWESKEIQKDKRLGSTWNLVNCGLKHIASQLKEGTHKYNIKKLMKIAAKIQAQILIETNVTSFEDKTAIRDFIFSDTFIYYTSELEVDCTGTTQVMLPLPDNPSSLGFSVETKSCARYFAHDYDFDKYFPKFHEHVDNSNCFLELDIRSRKSLEDAVGMKNTKLENFESSWINAINGLASQCSEFRYFEDNYAIVNLNLPGCGITLKELLDGLQIEDHS